MIDKGFILIYPIEVAWGFVLLGALGQHKGTFIQLTSRNAINHS